MGFGDIWIGILISLSALVLMVSGPVWGSICEWWGRRRVLLVGLMAAILFPPLFAVLVQARLSAAIGIETAFIVLLALRLCLVGLTGGLIPGAQAFLADITAAERRAGGMGLMGAAYGLGSIAGAALAWRLGGTSLFTALIAISILIAVATVGVWRFLAEPRHGSSARAKGASRIALAGIWPFLLITVCGLTVFSLLQQVTALRLQDEFGLSSVASIQRSGTIMMVTMLVMITIQGIMIPRLRQPPSVLLRAGASLAVVSMLIAAFAGSVVMLGVAMASLGCAFGLLLPANLALLSLRTGSGAQAKVAGMNAIGQGMGSALGPMIGASLNQISPSLPYGAGVLLLLVVCLLAFRWNPSCRSPDDDLRSPVERHDENDSHILDPNRS